MAKSYSEWSARKRELGGEPTYAEYQGYLNNIGASAPAPASSPAPVIKAPAAKPKASYGTQAANAVTITPDAQPAKQLSSKQAANVAMTERKAADTSPSQASFTTIHGSQGVTNPVFAQYAQKYPDLVANYNANWKDKGVSLAEYGAMHYAKYGKGEGRTLGADAPVAEESGGGEAGGGAGGGGGAPASSAGSSLAKDFESKAIYGDELAPIKPELASVQITGPESQVVEERVKNLVDQNSPLFRAAAGQAFRQLAARGLSNSSLAQQAVMDAVMAVAIPIATADATTFKEQSVLNQGFSNEFRAAQNAAYYAQEQQKLDGIIKETLAHISGQYNVQTAEISAEATKYGYDIQAAPEADKLEWEKNKAASTMQTPDGVKNVYSKVPNANQSINKAATYYS
jgi:hypothetical protein